MEHHRNKLEDYLSIVVAMSVKVNNLSEPEVNQAMPNQQEKGIHLATEGRPLNSLLNDLITNMEYELGTLSEVVEMRSSQTERREVISMLPSSGGRPAYNITKEQIEQLRETGMRWNSIADFLCISERTLHRRRIEFGIEHGFSKISDSDLDQNTHEILQLTPNSGETYVRGSQF